MLFRFPAFFRRSLGGSLHPQDFAECAGDGCAFKANLSVVHAVNIANKHIHAAVIPAIRQRKHFVKRRNSSQKGHESPKRSTAQMGPAYSLEFVRARYFDHGDTGADVHEEIGIYVWPRFSESDGLSFAIGEDLIWDFRYEEVQT